MNRLALFANEGFLATKAQSAAGPAWFRSLYIWTANHPIYQEYFYYTKRKRVIGYHNEEIVLRADGTISTGGATFVLDLESPDTFLAKLAFELQAKKPMVHPDVLSGAADNKEREVLKGFLTGLAGVQKMDATAVCLEAILPKIVTSAPAPSVSELLTLTKYCQQHLAPASIQGHELWIVNKAGKIRRASEVLFSAEFKPGSDWEKHKQFVPGVDFLAADYVDGCETSTALAMWRNFMSEAGVKQVPDNGVEVFATRYAEYRLSSRFRAVVSVEKLNHGYDLEAEENSGLRVYVEVKGFSGESNVELTGNESRAARDHGDRFYLCVVANVPDNPSIYLVRNPDRVGERDKLTIQAVDWKREPLE